MKWERIERQTTDRQRERERNPLFFLFIPLAPSHDQESAKKYAEAKASYERAVVLDTGVKALNTLCRLLLTEVRPPRRARI